MKTIKLIGLFLTVSVLFYSPASADVFQYFDEEGTLIVTSGPGGLERIKGHESLKRHEPVKGPERASRLAYNEGVSYDYYPVKGRNFHELVSQANLAGPLDGSDGRSYPAQTRWNLGWSYRYNYTYSMDGPLLRVSLNIYNVEFKSGITVILLALSSEAGLSEEDIQRWNGFVEGLIRHEEDHVRIVKDPENQDRTLKSFSALRGIVISNEPGADTDSSIKKAVEEATGKIGHDLVRAIKERNDAYDRVTEHGMRAEKAGEFFGGRK